MDDLSAAECRQHQTNELEDEGRAARNVGPGKCEIFVEHRRMAEESAV
jgi:hypothetical protein